MNILPKKRWHVRTKENVERVRRDEAKAREDALKVQQRVELAEQEARTDFLRQKARAHQSNAGSLDAGINSAGGSSQVAIQQNSTHVNFFENIEDGTHKHGTNKEYEAEKQAEKEKNEKAIGLLTYLGQSALDPQTSDPWWSKSRKRENEDDDNNKEANNEIDKRKKNAMDPMRDIEKYIEHKKKKKKKDHDHRSKPKKRDKDEKPKLKSVEVLRAERMDRERAERVKAERLMARLRGEVEEKPEEKVETDDRKRGYNSQYNPNMVRRPRHERRERDAAHGSDRTTNRVSSYYDHFR